MGSCKSKLLTPEVVNELIVATDFNTPEVHELHEQFMVACPTGAMDHEKFEHLYAVVFPAGDAKVFSDYLFTCFDENQDKKIDFREFLCALHVIARGSIDQKVDWMFKIYDQDKNGEIDKYEISDLVKVLYEMYGTRIVEKRFGISAPDMAKHLLESMDLNNDGRISLEEFRAAVSEDNEYLRCIFEMDPHTCL